MPHYRALHPLFPKCLLPMVELLVLKEHHSYRVQPGVSEKADLKD